MERLRATTEKQMWREDLDEFEAVSSRGLCCLAAAVVLALLLLLHWPS